MASVQSHVLGGALDEFLPISALSFPICEIESEESTRRFLWLTPWRVWPSTRSKLAQVETVARGG